MLYYDGKSETYLPVITGVVAIWLPHPTLEESKDDSMSHDCDLSEFDTHILHV